MDAPDQGHLNRLGINVERLESEMNSAVARDARYWLENDTKIRAVEQRVPTYEHFRQLVAGCHLRPLDRSELASLTKSKTNWNPAHVALGNVNYGDHPTAQAVRNSQPIQTPQQFYTRWQAISLCKTGTSADKNAQLADLVFSQQPTFLQELLDCGLGTALLPEMLSVFESITQSNDAPLDEQLVDQVLSVLSALSESKHFSLATDLLSDAEKGVAESLLGRLAAHPIMMQASDRIEHLKSSFGISPQSS